MGRAVLGAWCRCRQGEIPLGMRHQGPSSGRRCSLTQNCPRQGPGVGRWARSRREALASEARRGGFPEQALVLYEDRSLLGLSPPWAS